MTLKALLFDLDDTLIPSTQAYEAALKKVHLTPKSKAYLAARSAIKSRLGKKHPGARNRLLYFSEMAHRANVFSPLGVLNLMARYENALSAELKKAWRTLGRPALFKKLSERYTLAIVSNENTRTQLIKMTAIDPHAHFFKTIVTSEEMGVEKPHPSLFVEAMRRLKVPASACVMVGDSVEADIQPARRLGMRVVLTAEFLPGRSPIRKYSGAAILNMDALPSLLQAWR